MNAPSVVAQSKVATALFAFEEALGVMPHLTATQRRQIARAAASLVKECMQVQCDLSIALIRVALDS